MRIDREERLEKLKTQLDFILRALACMAADETDDGMRPTNEEAYAGCELAQQICEEMAELAMQPGEEISETKVGG